MKTNMKKTTYFLMAMTLVFAMSCGSKSGAEAEEGHQHAEGMEHNGGEEHPQGEAGEHPKDEAGEHAHAEGEGHDMQNMDHAGMMGEAFTWMAGKEAMGMMEYKTDNITLATSGEEDVLMFEPAGQSASCMFKGKQGNVGVTATVKLEKPDATVKLLHHSTGKDNYEFVAIEGNTMKLGRVENGEEKILDTKEVSVPNDWFTLTVTAAGTHFKGYLNGEMITHGHADEMSPGMLGIVVSGNGAVSVKKVEATPLEAEH